MFFETILDKASGMWFAVSMPSQKIFYIYLLSAFVIAAASYIFFASRDEGQRPDGIKKGMLGYIFDPEVWAHKSARQDYAYFVINALIYYGVISQLMIGGHVLFEVFGASLNGIFGVRENAIFEPGPTTFIIYTIVVALAADFAVFLTHYLQHKIATLWQFHMVHHSAEVMTPVTVYRMHPVDLFFTGLVGAVLITLAFAGYVYLTGSTPSQIMVMNVNIIVFSFYLVGYNLRHSHIWVSYPPWLSYIFISPAQHQTHHSIDEKHFDRNFGLIFAFWDWMFGTLYVPRGYEKLEYGLSREEPNPFGSVKDIYLKPFQGAWDVVRPTIQENRRRLIAIAGLTILASGFSLISSTGSLQLSAQSATVPTVHLEDLTWTEVAAAQAQGFDTIIIPTGGTEQNGPHVILGKHNYVIRAASEEIAEQLGHTLVAPVLSYVPEGDVGDEPSGHMQFPGTLTLPEPLFQSVLESAARSYKTHGFTKIVFVGDSGGNQESQSIVARRLSDEWVAEGVMVETLSDYYFKHGQVEYLVARGFTQDQIGQHAGIRDTSEVLQVAPHGVRENVTTPPVDWSIGPGANGDASRASAEIGEKMIELKVDAAVRQFRQLEANFLQNAS